jgi:outer membrane protein insertion porin family
LDRLVDLFREKGYLRFGREQLYGLWDTVDVELLRPTVDPFEQLEILQKLSARRQNPTANLDIRLRPNADSNRLIKYYVGNITVYPDFSADTLGLVPTTVVVNDIKVVYYEKIFKPKIFGPNIYLHHGDVYNQKEYLRTIDRFNSLGSWRSSTIEPRLRSGEDTVDFNIRLIPASKYLFNTNIEGSNNQSSVSGNLFGVAINVGLQNRNFARGAIQSNSNLRFGIELGDSSLVQTKQISISQNFIVPRFIPNVSWVPQRWKQNARTIFSFNAANTDRLSLFNLTTINGSWGYEFQIKNKLLTIKFPNVEFSNLSPRPQLEELFTNNPSLRNIFTDGFIFSSIGSLAINGGKNKNVNAFKANIEESGLLLGMVKSKFLDSNLYRFIKADAEFTRKIQFNKSALALRFFAGAGYELDSTGDPNKRSTLPFFKQYFAGGPNSMRAWALRKLGPGSLVRDFKGTNGIPERYGDVQLEANIEYRFPITTISGVKLNGALFSDIGNVWFLKKKANLATPEAVFGFNKLGNDIAIGLGTGLRVDFSFFIVRFDYSYKVKDPSPSPDRIDSQNKWFYNWKPLNGQFQLGISYPFIL